MQIQYTFKQPPQGMIAGLQLIAASLGTQLTNASVYQLAGVITALNDMQKHESVDVDAWIKAAVLSVASGGITTLPGVEKFYLEGPGGKDE